MTVPNYPLPYDPDDDRLDEDLVGLVADLIAFRTGYPDIDGPDLERLRQALHEFLYRPVVEIRCTCEDVPDPDCRIHASRFRRLCDNPAPHGEHRWKSPAAVGAATWTCPGVPTWGGAR